MTDSLPAFPHVSDMGMRDYLASQALVGLCANRSLIDGGSDKQYADVALSAYLIADAMLAARRTHDDACDPTRLWPSSPSVMRSTNGDA